MKRRWTRSTPLIVVLVILAVTTPASPIIPSYHRPTSLSQTPTIQFPNIPIVGEAPPDRQQAEPTIAVDPRNPSIIVAGSQDYRLKAVGEHRWHGYYRSIDGGQTWTDGLLPGFPGDNSTVGLASILHQSNASSDPVLAFDIQGNLYYAGLAFNVTSTTDTGTPVAFVAKYTNDGADYSGVALIPGTVYADKPWIAVDTSSGPSQGTIYVAVDAQLKTSSLIATVLTRSTDGGRSFSQPVYAPSDQTGELPGIIVDGSGDVYISSVAVDPSTGRPLDYVQVTKMTGGGTSQAQNARVVSGFAPLNNSIPGAKFRNASIPQITADELGIYLVWDDLSTGTANVFFARSTDGGSHWTSPEMVNDSILGQHFFPTITASAGVISVAWYDSRLNNDSQSITSLDVYYSYSMDHGVSFSSNIRVSSVSFNPDTVLRSDPPDENGYFLGDYIQIAASPIAAHVIWTDNRFACDTRDPVYGCLDQDAITATVNLRDFTVSASPPSLILAQGENGTTGITVSNTSLLDENVTVHSTPSGLPVSPPEQFLSLPPATSKIVDLTVSTRSSTPQTFNLNITASSSYIAHSVFVSVTVESVLMKAATTLVNQIKAVLVPFVLGLIVLAGIAIGLFYLRRGKKLNSSRAV